MIITLSKADLPGMGKPRANHKYVSRERKDGKWVYTYADGSTGQAKPAAAKEPVAQAAPPAEPAQAPAPKKGRQSRDDKFREMMKNARAELERHEAAKKAYDAEPHAVAGTPRGDAHAALAEGTGDQKGEVTLQALAAKHPKTFDRHLKDGDSLTAMLGHFVMKNFPPSVPSAPMDTPEKKKRRETEYREAFEAMSGVLDRLKDDTSVNQAIVNIKAALDPIMDRSRQFMATNKYADPMHQQLYDFLYKDVLGRKKTSFASIADGLSSAARHASDDEPGHKKRLGELVKEYMGGGDAQSMLSIGRNVVRKGPELPQAATMEGQKHILQQQMKIKSVTFVGNLDASEREHHQQNLTLSLHDLASATGLPEEMCSFNGRLAINIGAKNRGDASAFYQAGTRSITLSAEHGAGSLAHEWGHFFDNILSSLTGGGAHSFATGRSKYSFTDDAAGKAVADSIEGVMDHPAMHKFVERMQNDKGWKEFSSSHKKYWASSEERWARCFERFVSHKLESKGQKNTYLVNNDSSFLWPNKEEVAEMAPAFDAVFEAAKKHGFIHKAMRMLQKDALSKAMSPSDPLASVYAAVDPQMTPQDAADIGNLLMPDWTPAQHREVGLAKQALAQTFLGSDKPGHENEAMQAMAAAFVHLSAAGQQPTACISPLDDDRPVLAVAEDGLVNSAGVMKSGGLLGTTKFGQAVHVGGPLPEHKDKNTSAAIAHGKHVATTHPTFSKQDHYDASAMHSRAAKTFGTASAQGKHHLAMANAHIFAAPLKKSKAGGPKLAVVPHSGPSTPGGHPIHAAEHPSYAHPIYNHRAKAGIDWNDEHKVKHQTLKDFSHYSAADHDAAGAHHHALSVKQKAAGGEHFQAGLRSSGISAGHVAAASHLRGLQKIKENPGKSSEWHGGQMGEMGSANHENHEAHRAAALHLRSLGKSSSLKTSNSQAARKAQIMITLDESVLSKAVKYGVKPLGTTTSGKTIHGLRQNMNAPIANGIVSAGKKADPGAMAHHIHQFNSGFTKNDHQDAAIAHKTQAAVLRSKGNAGFNSSNPARQRASAEHFAHAERHQALAMAHYHASKATGRGTGPSRKVQPVIKSEAESVLQDYLGKAMGGGKSLGYTGGKITGHEIFSSSHSNYTSGHFTPRSGRSELGKKQRATGAMNHVLKKFPTMSGADHAEAARMHQQNHAGGGKSALVAMAHEHAAAHLTKLGKSLSKADGEGSRGGKIVGHTKSGKPIYAGHSEHYAGANKGTSKQSNKDNLAHGQKKFPDYSRQDHVDAADHHWNAVKKYSDEHGAKSIQDLPKHMAASVFATRVHNRVEEHMLKESEKGGSAKKSFAKFESNFNVRKSEAWMDLFKATGKGEGSRGGKIIGHTRSGKPVYASGHASYSKIKHEDGTAHDVMDNAEHVHSSAHHDDWTTADHYDAGQLHQVKAANHPKSNAITTAHYLAGDFVRDHQEKNDGSHGKTEGGKPFSASTPAHKYGPGFNANDHDEAADHYRQAAKQHAAKGDHEKAAKFKKMAKDHQVIADNDPRAEKSSRGHGYTLSKAKGEGSRGGKVIAHTKSGKPIYASHGPAHQDYHGFSAGDHSEAAAAHGMKALSSFKKMYEAKSKEDAEKHYSVGLGHQGAALLHSEHAAGTSNAGTAAPQQATQPAATAKKPRKPVSGKRSIGWNVAKPKTDTGKAIPVDGSSKYKALDHNERQKAIYGDMADRDAAGHRGPGFKMKKQEALANKDADAMAHHFKGWSKQDHQDAADHHEDGNYHQASMAHQVLADRMDAKKSLRVNLDTLSLAKGFLVAPNTYFWGTSQPRVS